MFVTEVNVNASVALKIAKHGAENYSSIEYGPIFGIDERIIDKTKDTTINISHVFPFPHSNQNNNNQNKEDNFFVLRNAQLNFQNDLLAKLKMSKVGVKLLGWFLSTTGGKFINQSVVESMINLTINNQTENRDDIAPLLLVHDPSKSLEGNLSLRCFTINEDFIKTYKSQEKFTYKNTISNELTYKNILQEIKVNLLNNHLINLKIQDEFDGKLDDFDNLKLTNQTFHSTTNTLEQLFDSIDSYNYNLGNFHYYQRSLSREVSKLNQWKQQVKFENSQKLKENPNLNQNQLINVDDEKNYPDNIKLPQAPSRYTSLINSSLIDNYCNDLEVSGQTELLKTVSIKKGLDI